MTQIFDNSKMNFFTQALMPRHATHHRPLPWKGEKNPYLIWLSEIILQQTRVEQGLPYFKKFKEKYPIVTALAGAPEDEVMKMWEGLGYYSRARHLHAAAKYIAGELGGIFPKTYDGIRALKGVGDYTAAAIASFAYDLPHAVVDGNVYRVLSRYFGMEEPVDTTAGKKLFARLAQALLDESQPGRYNQAIMDFGASQCTPASPECGACPLRERCLAFEKGMVNSLPVKSKKLERKTRFFNYLVIRQAGSVFIKKRKEKDIWRNLYDFPLLETERLPEKREDLTGSEAWQQTFGETVWRLSRISQPFKQELTHRKIMVLFWEIETGASFEPPQNAWLKVRQDVLSEFAFPRVIGLYFRQKFLPLEIF